MRGLVAARFCQKDREREEMSQTETPENIIQLGLGFWAAKVLLSAVELELFTELAKGPMDAEDPRAANLHQRSVRDFLDTLVSVKMLDRDAKGQYANTSRPTRFSTRQAFIHWWHAEMANTRLYGFWGS